MGGGVGGVRGQHQLYNSHGLRPVILSMVVASELQSMNKRSCTWEESACSFYHVHTANHFDQEIQLDHSKVVEVFLRLLRCLTLLQMINTGFNQKSGAGGL